MDRNGVKIPYDLAAHFAEGKVVHVFAGYEGTTFLNPFAVKPVYGARFFLIRAHTVDAAHENVSEECAVGRPKKQLGIQMKAGIGFDAGQVQGDHGDLRHTGFFQGAPDKAHIVGGAASAAGLGHDDRNFIQVIAP